MLLAGAAVSIIIDHKNIVKSWLLPQFLGSSIEMSGANTDEGSRGEDLGTPSASLPKSPPFACMFCIQANFQSKRGLSCHVTRMHADKPEEQQPTSNAEKSSTKKRKRTAKNGKESNSQKKKKKKVKKSTVSEADRPTIIRQLEEGRNALESMLPQATQLLVELQQECSNTTTATCRFLLADNRIGTMLYHDRFVPLVLAMRNKRTELELQLRQLRTLRKPSKSSDKKQYADREQSIEDLIDRSVASIELLTETTKEVANLSPENSTWATTFMQTFKVNKCRVAASDEGEQAPAGTEEVKKKRGPRTRTSKQDTSTRKPKGIGATFTANGRKGQSYVSHCLITNSGC